MQEKHFAEGEDALSPKAVADAFELGSISSRDMEDSSLSSPPPSWKPDSPPLKPTTSSQRHSSRLPVPQQSGRGPLHLSDSTMLSSPHALNALNGFANSFRAGSTSPVRGRGGRSRGLTVGRPGRAPSISMNVTATLV
eukprot:TRINITY_DN976_c0_g1_i1.p1 TRINITY_DN976_c0_g1~~TRINITY_DN976_c0_g1_i1.p1  ORF type:complete len:154 (+),score=14.67 TRINITY_DN976_c0_g1_i1:49-462(+)